MHPTTASARVAGAVGCITARVTVTTLLVALVVFLAFTTETVLGFGATVITLALGAALVPLRPLLAALIPLNLALSAYLTARHWRDVDVRALTRRIGPPMLAAMPVGMLLAARLPAAWLVRAFGLFVLALASIELRRMRRAQPATDLSRNASLGLLALGGAVHGMFGVGGPLVVWVVSRWFDDRHRVRATLNALWLTLNVIFLAPMALDGTLSRASLGATITFVPSLVAATWAGEKLHARVPESTFRKAVYAMLLAAGVVLVVRGA